VQNERGEASTITQDFFTGSLKSELHPVCQGNLSLICTISKGLQNPQDHTFKICKKIQPKILELHKNQYKHNKTTLVDLENHQE